MYTHVYIVGPTCIIFYACLIQDHYHINIELSFWKKKQPHDRDEAAEFGYVNEICVGLVFAEKLLQICFFYYDNKKITT